MMENKITLVREGNYWTLYIGSMQCGCGSFGDMVEAMSTLESWEDAVDYANRCQEVL